MTGERENMGAFGYLATKYAETGHPTRYESRRRGQQDIPNWVIQRTVDKKWRIVYYEAEGLQWPREQKVLSPLFPGPIAAAMWLEVEKSNGTVRFAES